MSLEHEEGDDSEYRVFAVLTYIGDSRESGKNRKGLEDTSKTCGESRLKSAESFAECMMVRLTHWRTERDR